MKDETNFKRFVKDKKKYVITPEAEQLKELRESFDFTQKQMADVLGIHPNALQRMEYGSSRIPKYIKHEAISFTLLNENRLFMKYINSIGVEL